MLINQPARALKKAKKAVEFRRNFELLLMTLPVLVFIFIFNYVPMYGIILAFKEIQFDLGILKSPWVGMDNFLFFFTSADAWLVTRNTVLMNLLFITINTTAAVSFAIMLSEITGKRMVKAYQTVMFFPYFLSWVVVGYMLYAFVHYKFGIINNLLETLGLERVDWYTSPQVWPLTFAVTSLWKSVGMGSVVYYAAIIGIDREYYEAAEIDGATRWSRIRYITLPFLKPLVTILTILAIGGLFRADFGMFFFLPNNLGNLFETTGVIDTYVYNALTRTSEMGMASAIGLYQSVVGCVLILVANAIVKRIEPDNALF